MRFAVENVIKQVAKSNVWSKVSDIKMIKELQSS